MRIWKQSRSNDCSTVQWVDIDTMLASVMWETVKSNDCRPVQWCDSDMIQASDIRW